MGFFTQTYIVKGIATCADGGKYSFKSPVKARFVTLKEVEEGIRQRLQFELGKRVTKVQITEGIET
jgi:hypothetical protein